ncbi:MAG TPA: PP2C family protein-serine/threonine phosphatase [Thermoanaerobaculia bacterium]|nr:PP2C family protein-serine/threonine phosphatase [Thermoanaerobaculia bacterium]
MPPFPRREFARYAVFALAAGGVVGYFISGQLRARPIAHGALIGFCCYAAAFLAEQVFHRYLEARPEAWWRRAIIYFVASQVAWPIGMYLGLIVLWGVMPWNAPLKVPWMFILGISFAGTLAGIGVYGYERLKTRLRESIEQLKEKEFADKELQLARELQSRMLPQPEIAADGYRISGRNFAARYVAGDFYDVFHYADGAVGVAVADVAGKGMAASLIMASVKAVLPLLASTRSIADAMAALNEKLHKELAKREFVALSLARYDPATGHVDVANAGLPDPYLVHGDGGVSVVEVPGPRLPLGLKRAIAYEKFALTLEHGDSLMLYSDGLPEATTHSGEQIGYEGLAAIVRTSGSDVDAIMKQIHAVEAGPRDDDQTVVMLRRV